MNKSLADIFDPERFATGAAGVFGAASQFASMALADQTAKLKERNDIQLRAFEAGMTVELQNKIRDTPFNGDRGEYEDQLKDFAAGLLEQGRGQNNSPYYQQMLSHLHGQSDVMLHDLSLRREDEWRVQQAGVAYEKALNSAANSPDSSPGLRLELMEAALKEYNMAVNGLSPGAYAKQQEAIYKQCAMKELAAAQNVSDLGDGTEENPGAMGRVKKAFEKWNVGGDAWGFGGKEEWEDALVKQHTERINKEHGQIIQARQGEYERLIMLDQIEGPGGARELGKKWGTHLNTYYPGRENDGNLSGQQLRQFDGYFNVGELEGYLQQKNGAEAARLDISPDTYIRAVIEEGGWVQLYAAEDGETRAIRYETFAEVKDHFISMKEQVFRYKNGIDPDSPLGPIASIKYEDELQDWLKEWNASFKRIIDETGNEMLKSALSEFTSKQTYITNKDGKNPFYSKELNDKNISQEQIALHAQNCLSFATDLIMTTKPDPVEWMRRIKQFTDDEITKILEWGNTPNEEGDYYKKLAKWSEEAKSDLAEDVVFTDDKGNVCWRSGRLKQSAETVRQMELKEVARLLGVSATEVEANWMRSRQIRDIIPKGTFTVRGGTYCLEYDDSANMVLKKQDDGGAWVERPPSNGERAERPLTKNEQKVKEGQQAQKQVDASYEFDRNKAAYRKMIADGIDPLTKQPADHSKPPPDARRGDTLLDAWLRYYKGQALGGIE